MDGVYGSATAEAVRKYRKRYGFPDNGAVDSTLFEHSKEKIRRIQRALREKGYPTAAEEGYADANLIEQIRAYPPLLHDLCVESTVCSFCALL
ncbi:hypothetical protein GR255_26670 [Mycobacterium tuberculosis]|nr:hypothetical protein [Mycobacterium tuberculosis]